MHYNDLLTNMDIYVYAGEYIYTERKHVTSVSGVVLHSSLFHVQQNRILSP